MGAGRAGAERERCGSVRVRNRRRIEKGRRRHGIGDRRRVVQHDPARVHFPRADALVRPVSKLRRHDAGHQEEVARGVQVDATVEVEDQHGDERLVVLAAPRPHRQIGIEPLGVVLATDRLAGEQLHVAKRAVRIQIRIAPFTLTASQRPLVIDGPRAEHVQTAHSVRPRVRVGWIKGCRNCGQTIPRRRFFFRIHRPVAVDQPGAVVGLHQHPAGRGVDRGEEEVVLVRVGVVGVLGPVAVAAAGGRVIRRQGDVRRVEDPGPQRVRVARVTLIVVVDVVHHPAGDRRQMRLQRRVGDPRIVDHVRRQIGRNRTRGADRGRRHSTETIERLNRRPARNELRLDREGGRVERIVRARELGVPAVDRPRHLVLPEDVERPGQVVRRAVDHISQDAVGDRVRLRRIVDAGAGFQHRRNTRLSATNGVPIDPRLLGFAQRVEGERQAEDEEQGQERDNDHRDGAAAPMRRVVRPHGRNLRRTSFKDRGPLPSGRPRGVSKFPE